MTYKKKAMNKKWFICLILLFLVWRVIDFLITYFAPNFIPFLGFFPYQNQLSSFNFPHWINSLASFDGIHYLLISKNGYSQFEQAFFPLYPLLIRYFTPIIGNWLLSGLIISNISFLIGLIFLSKTVQKIKNEESNLFFLLVFILAFPTSFFFGAVYTEGLFFLLFTASLYFLKKEKYLIAALFAAVASATRLIGVFLLIPFFFKIIRKLKIKNLTLLISPLIGLSIYSFYLYKTTGDPLYFLTTQPLFGANRSTHLIVLPQVIWRYIKIFITANHNFQYFVSVIEFIFFNIVFIILVLDLITNLGLKIKNYWRIGLNIFSFANLILPTLTGSLSSIPRYSLFSISFFLYLSEIKEKWIKIAIVIIFIIFHVILLGLFSQGYFIS